jgi:tetratricopeptide (TPR) repeat protein
MEQKTFNKVLIEFNLNPQRVKNYFEDKRMTLLEKKILEGYLYVRDNQNSQAILLVDSLAKSNYPFVEAQKFLLMGIAQNNLTQFAEAEKNLLQSLEIFNELQTVFFQFITRFNLFIIYHNINNKKMMKENLLVLERLKLVEHNQTKRLLRIKFMYHSHLNEIDEACKALKDIEPYLSQFSESDVISHLIVVFMFYLKIGELHKCQETLQSIKAHRKYQMSDNFKFMKRMLDHLMYNSPLYCYNDDFKSMPQLFHQFKVIQALEENNKEEADKHWQALKEMSPDHHLEEYDFRGPKCLFSVCLDKHKKVLRPKGIASINEESKIKKLLHIIETTEYPIPKAMLYEQIWGKVPESKEDINKLARMIYKIKTKFGIDIKTRKGTYYIEKIQRDISLKKA